MAEAKGSGSATGINEARCFGGGSYRALERARRCSTSIAGKITNSRSDIYILLTYPTTSNEYSSV